MLFRKQNIFLLKNANNRLLLLQGREKNCVSAVIREIDTITKFLSRVLKQKVKNECSWAK